MEGRRKKRFYSRFSQANSRWQQRWSSGSEDRQAFGCRPTSLSRGKEKQHASDSAHQRARISEKKKTEKERFCFCSGVICYDLPEELKQTVSPEKNHRELQVSSCKLSYPTKTNKTIATREM